MKSITANKPEVTNKPDVTNKNKLIENSINKVYEYNTESGSYPNMLKSC